MSTEVQWIHSTWLFSQTQAQGSILDQQLVSGASGGVDANRLKMPCFLSNQNRLLEQKKGKSDLRIMNNQRMLSYPFLLPYISQPLTLENNDTEGRGKVEQLMGAFPFILPYPSLN